MWAMVRSFGPADPVDALVGLLGGFAQFAVGGLLVRGDHSLADVSLVGDPSGGVDSVEQSGGVQGGRVVHGPRIGVGGPHQPAVGQDQDLDVHAGRPVLARPQFAVSAPTPAGEEGAVEHVVAALGHLLRGEQHVLQGPGDRVGHGPDGPRDRGLGHTQLLADHHLHHIVAHVDQRRPQGVPQPQARRIPLDALLAQADEQIGELGGGQSRGILHGDGPFLMRSSSLMFVDHCTSWWRAIIISFSGNARRRPLNKLRRVSHRTVKLIQRVVLKT